MNLSLPNFSGNGSPANASVMTKRLNKAGIRSPHALMTLYGPRPSWEFFFPPSRRFS